MGCPPPHLTRGSGERRELPQPVADPGLSFGGQSRAPKARVIEAPQPPRGWGWYAPGTIAVNVT